MTKTRRACADDLSGESLRTAAVFGFCPDCHREPAGYVNIGWGHWFYCPGCETRWFAGSNLFSTWRDETKEEQRRKASFFYEEDYREVERYTPPALQVDSMPRNGQSDTGDTAGAVAPDGEMPF